MAEYSDEFNVSSDPESLNELPEFEGANCLRVVTASLFFSGRPAYLYDIEEQLSDLGVTNWLPNDNFTSRITGREEREMIANTIFIRRQYISEELSNELRRDLWNRAVADSTNFDAQFAFVATMLFSSLERESLISAIAILKAIPLLNNGWYLNESKRIFQECLNERFFDGFQYATSNEISLRQMAAQFFSASQDFRPDDWNALCKHAVSLTKSTSFTNGLAIVVSLSYARLVQAKASDDFFVQEAVAHTFLGESTRPLHKKTNRTHYSRQSPRMNSLSTIVHGTWAKNKVWWKPGGDFFNFSKTTFCSDLYDGKNLLTWQGFLSSSNRIIAAENLYSWCQSESLSRSLNILFAHSYGGDIAGRAILNGLHVNELILLSTPVTKTLVNAISRVPKVIDIRLRFDFVIWIASEFQKLPPHSRAIRILPRSLRYKWNHSSSHDVGYWQAESVISQIGH